MKIKELLNIKGIECFSIMADQTLSDASKQMAECRIGALLVMDKGKLAGIVTERDIVRAVANDKTCKDVRIREVMSTKRQGKGQGHRLPLRLSRSGHQGVRLLLLQPVRLGGVERGQDTARAGARASAAGEATAAVMPAVRGPEDLTRSGQRAHHPVGSGTLSKRS